MKKYKFFDPRGVGFCVPACVQSVLEMRRFYPPSQEEIADELDIGSKGLFVQPNLEPLKTFFERRNLSLSLFNPFYNNTGSDIFLMDAMKRDVDVMVGFFYGDLYGEQRGGCGNGSDNRHFALVSDFKLGLEKEVFLHDNQRRKVEPVSLADLNNSMRGDARCGFYVIG